MQAQKEKNGEVNERECYFSPFVRNAFGDVKSRFNSHGFGDNFLAKELM